MGTEHATRPAFLPGQPLPVPSDTNASVGDGVYAKDGVFRASRMGHFESDGNATLLSVRGERPPLVIPRPESTIFGRVTRVMPRQATVSILVVDGLPCGGALNAAGASTNRAAGEGIDGADFQGILRQQDVRSTEKDSVVLSQCFRPGDILRAVVISLGDARSYYLSTAGNHLGQ
ncbi:Csl4p [Malassezia vespertilionis]|uniref:Csl4p n=1 Tax=Malassezia vespertilionis TaxID=2020962 RepID=A0A2N1JH87_9BASI|nr:Csl4p [Malassezia vespertilionis]